MKRFFRICLIALSVLTLTSCGSKVNEKELNDKIENWNYSDGVKNFTQDEFEFMIDYLTKQIDQKKEVDPNGEGAEKLGSYMIILNIADSQGELKGKAKEKWEDFKKKFETVMQTEQSAAQMASDSIEEIPEYGEIVEEYVTIDTVVD